MAHATPPFLLDESKPADSDIVSQHPAVARSVRDNIEAWMDFEHGMASGRHKIPAGSVAARDGITDWEKGSFWINTDATPAALQMNTGTKSTPVWVNVAEVLLAVANVFTATQTIVSTDAGADEGPDLVLDRDSASPAVSDLIGRLILRGEDDGGGDVDYVELLGKILDPAAANPDSAAILRALIAGTATDIITAGPGVQVGAPTGGDKGVGTLNAVGVYDDGVLLVTSVIAASQAQMEAATSTTVHSSPGRQHYHPGSVKAWVSFEQIGAHSIFSDYNVTSVVDIAEGTGTINWETDFSNTDYCVVGMNAVMASEGQGLVFVRDISDILVGSVVIESKGNTTKRDAEVCFIAAFGDH